MSVTFSAGFGPTTGYTFECGVHDATSPHVFSTYEEADDFRIMEHAKHGGTGHLAACGDEFCAAMPVFVKVVEDHPSPEVNISSLNARHILGVLGFGDDADLSGSAQPADMLGRILMAEAINPADAGIPATSTTSSGGMVMVECGRVTGYTEGILSRLHEVVEFATAHGREVQWA